MTIDKSIIKKRKKFPLIAGMNFTYPYTKNNELKKIGFYIIEFYYQTFPDGDSVLIGEKQIKRVIY